jgi:hypothetical protein
LFPDGGEGAANGAVEEEIRWLGWFVAEVDGSGVSLVGADAAAVVREGEALFGAGRDEFVEFGSSQGLAVVGACVEEDVDVDPAVRVERDADGAGLVPEDVAQEFAGGGAAGGVHREWVVGRP